MKLETDEVNPDQSYIFEDITVQAIVIHTEATLYHNTEIDETTTGAIHDDFAQPTEDTAADLNHDTLHQLHCQIISTSKALQAIDLEITVDHIHDHSNDLQDINLTIQTHIPAG